MIAVERQLERGGVGGELDELIFGGLVEGKVLARPATIPRARAAETGQKRIPIIRNLLRHLPVLTDSTPFLRCRIRTAFSTALLVFEGARLPSFSEWTFGFEERRRFSRGTGLALWRGTARRCPVCFSFETEKLPCAIFTGPQRIARIMRNYARLPSRADRLRPAQEDQPLPPPSLPLGAGNRKSNAVCIFADNAGMGHISCPSVRMRGFSPPLINRFQLRSPARLPVRVFRRLCVSRAPLDIAVRGRYAMESQ